MLLQRITRIAGRRPARAAAAAVAAATVGAGLLTVPQAYADGGVGTIGGIAFASGTSPLLSTDVPGGGLNTTQFGIMPGTNPSITSLSPTPGNYGFEIAFQAAGSGHLWTVGALASGDTGLTMKAGTSPAVTALPDGGYAIAFQSDTGELVITGSGGTWHSGLGVMAGTSPSIAAQPNGGYDVAFQAGGSGDLWTVGTAGAWDSGLGMMGGTSPSITTLVGGGYEIAYQAGGTGDLSTVGNGGAWNTGLGMMAGTSPSITEVPYLTAGYQVAFQTNTGTLYTAGTLGSAPLNDSVMAGTSPSIIGISIPVIVPPGTINHLPTSLNGYEIAYHNNSGTLSLDEEVAGDPNNGVTNLDVPMSSGSSPSLAPYVTI